MSNDSVLKKEFKQNDVQRLRNLVQGKYGDRTSMGTGYSKAKEFHDEGDIWEEDGRNWTIKNGVKQNITKLDKAKEGIVLPLFCPSCSRSMKPHLDKRWFVMYGHCFNCQVDFEAGLKKQGKLQEFEDQVNQSGELEHEQMAAEEPQQQGITQEVMEFITSMYDSQTGTFPRGEEGVKIACEKKFGEQAGNFAHYVVEKLSAKTHGMATPPMQEQPVAEPVQADPMMDSLARIKELAKY
jgi:hypothetical protein